MKRFLLIPATALILFGCNNSARYAGDVVKQEYIHAYGVKIGQSQWVAEGRTGSVVQTMKDGTVVTKQMLNGVVEGDVTSTFPHSKVVFKRKTFNEGQLIRVVTNYGSGMPSFETRQMETGNRAVTRWYESGTPKSIEEYKDNNLIKGEYFTTANEVESRVILGDGTRIVRDEFGQQTRIEQIEAGELVMATRYHPNGAPMELTPYVDRKVHGEKKTFLASGEPDAIELWEEGTQQGVTTLFRSGAKISELPYVQGKREGVEKRFGDGTSVVEEVSWHRDVQHGPAKVFVAGKSQTTYFHEGKLVTKLQFQELNGTAR
jgi:antitoxin component YwqK of YwqJK toxin-antitoxin module